MALPASLFALHVPANAAGPNFNGYISVEEMYTDNVAGSNGGSDSDLVTTLSAGANFRKQGAKNSINVGLAVFGDFYLDTDDLDDFRVQLNGNSKSEIVDGKVFFNTNVSVSEEFTSQSGTNTASDRTTGDNKSRIINYSLSPNARFRLGDLATGNASYRFSQVVFGDAGGNSSSGGIEDSMTHAVNINLNRVAGRTTYRARSSYSAAYNGDELDSERYSFSGGVVYKITRHFSVFTDVGIDFFDDLDIDSDSLDGIYYGVGFDWAAGPRTNLSLSVDHRYDDIFLTGTFSHRFSPHTRVSASYSVDVLTQQQALTRTLLDENRTLDPNAFPLDLVDSTQLVQVFDLKLSGSTGRGSYNVGMNILAREVGTSNDTDHSYRLNAGYSRSFTNRLNGGVTAAYAITEQSTASGDGTQLNLGADFSYTVAPKVSLQGYYNFLHDDDPGGTTTENVLGVRIRKSF
ncbi:MAG: TIGR03016 family PEP-CTERM system-associated outer membrane protein [Magnetospiraceae bacterium]